MLPKGGGAVTPHGVSPQWSLGVATLRGGEDTGRDSEFPVLIGVMPREKCARKSHPLLEFFQNCYIVNWRPSLLLKALPRRWISWQAQGSIYRPKT